MKLIDINYSNGYKPLFSAGMHLNNRKKKKQLVCVILAVFMICYLFYIILYLQDFLQIYQNQILKSKTFWNQLLNSNIFLSSNLHNNLYLSDNQCISHSKIQRKEYNAIKDLYEFFDFLNEAHRLNYFMCFSTMFYAVRIQNYNSYRSVYNTSDFNRLNEFYKHKNKDKCVDVNYDLNKMKHILNWNSPENPYSADIHLCVLNENNWDFCKIFVNDYNKRREENIKCSWNFWNGEYKIEFGESLKLIIHVYETSMKKHTLLSYWNLQTRWLPANTELIPSNTKHKLNLNEKAYIKVGLMGYLNSGGDFLQMPLYFFYNDENRSAFKFNYLNYLGVPIRLPSAIIDYLTLFYSKLWYI